MSNTSVQAVGVSERAIVVMKDDVAGAGAVNYIQMTNSRTGIATSIKALGTDTNIAIDVAAKGISPVRLMSHGGLGENLRIVPSSTTPTDYLTIGGTAGGAKANIGAAGASTDIDIRLTPKGAGVVQYGTHAAIGAETVTGYITIKDSVGTSRKIAVVS